MSDLLSRKFIFAVILVIMGFVLTLYKFIGGEDFLHFAEIIGGTYVIGNVAENAINQMTGQ